MSQLENNKPKMPENHAKVFGDIKPHWLKTRLRTGEDFAYVARVVESHALNTICSSGRCPNKVECWNHRTATFMILGDVCTRSCRFCATSSGKPLPVDEGEPHRVADSIRKMGLKHAVITSVTRDDLADGGVSHWAATIREAARLNPGTTIEVLIPDFDARREPIEAVALAGPAIMGHNIECVSRITPLVRSRADYPTSLRTLMLISQTGATAKSGLMVGLGESQAEVVQTLRDLHSAGCRIVTIGQYLRPTPKHLPVAEYVRPEQFEKYKDIALDMGFSYVASAPLVRSSYMAERALEFC